MARVNVDLLGDAAAASRAREALERWRGVLDDELLDDISLLTTELITNSVRHGGMADGSPVGLRAEVNSRRVRVEVSDRGQGFDPADEAPSADVATGWGLFLVDEVADRWGIEHGRPVRVWFEIDRS